MHRVSRSHRYESYSRPYLLTRLTATRLANSRIRGRKVKRRANGNGNGILRGETIARSFRKIRAASVTSVRSRSRFGGKRRAARNRSDEIARGGAAYSRLRRCKTPPPAPRPGSTTDRYRTGGLRPPFDVDQAGTRFPPLFPENSAATRLEASEDTRSFASAYAFQCAFKIAFDVDNERNANE